MSGTLTPDTALNALTIDGAIGVSQINGAECRRRADRR